MIKKKVSICTLLLMALLMVFPLCASAAAPTVQEVESLISGIGTVSRENRTTVENAVKAYDQLDDTAKSQVSNYAVLAEAQQILGIQDALAKLTHEHDKVEDWDSWVSSLYNESCTIAPAIYMFPDKNFPVAALLFGCDGNDLLDIATVKVRTDKDLYTYNRGAFLYCGPSIVEEEGKNTRYLYAITLIEEFDYNMLLDIVHSDEAIVRLESGSTIKLPNYIDYTLTESDYQAIDDTMYAYYLMCQADYSTLLKAIA